MSVKASIVAMRGRLSPREYRSKGNAQLQTTSLLNLQHCPSHSTRKKQTPRLRSEYISLESQSSSLGVRFFRFCCIVLREARRAVDERAGVRSRFGGLSLAFCFGACCAWRKSVDSLHDGGAEHCFACSNVASSSVSALDALRIASWRHLRRFGLFSISIPPGGVAAPSQETGSDPYASQTSPSSKSAHIRYSRGETRAGPFGCPSFSSLCRASLWASMLDFRRVTLRPPFDLLRRTVCI